MSNPDTASDRAPDCIGTTRVTYLLWAIILAVVMMYLYLLHRSIADGNYMPVWSDEYEYQKNMESFVQNGNLVTSLSLEENYAKIFGSSGHGFAYNLTNGLLAKAFGLSNLTIIYINFAITFLSSSLLWVINFFPVKEKLLLTATILLSPIVIFFSFSYMMESYQLLFGVVLSLIIAKAYQNHFNEKSSLSLIFMFYLCVIIATAYRQTWALWGCALVPLGRNGKQIICHTLLSLLLLAYSYIFSACFLAPYPYDPRAYIFSAFMSGNITQGFTLTYNNLLKNLNLYFSLDTDTVGKSLLFDYRFITRMTLLGISLYYPLAFIIKKERYYLTATLVTWTTLIPVFLLFTTESSATQRHLAPLYYFSVIFLALSKNRIDRALSVSLLLIQIVILVPVLSDTINSGIQPKKILSTFRLSKTDMLSSIATMVSENIREDGLTTIYLSTEIPPVDFSLMLYSLPNKTSKGAQLRYTLSPFSRDIKLFNKVNVAYLIVPNNLVSDSEDLRLVAESYNIRLYKVLKSPDNGIIKRSS